MNNKVRSIIWLRGQQLITSSQYLILIIMPYIFAWIYKYLLPENQIDDNFILFVCLPMLFSISVGSLIASIVAEEKEKNNLKGLYLAGVSNLEYVIGSLFFPVIIGILGIILIPVLIGKTDFENYAIYFLISLLTAIAILLVNLLIGIKSKTLSQAQIITMPIMMITMLLPLFTTFNETITKYIKYTYIGSFTEMFQTPNSFLFKDTSFYALLIWIVLLISLNLWSFKKIKFN